jgi:hypothetical protein
MYRKNIYRKKSDKRATRRELTKKLKTECSLLSLTVTKPKEDSEWREVCTQHEDSANCLLNESVSCANIDVH